MADLAVSAAPTTAAVKAFAKISGVPTTAAIVAQWKRDGEKISDWPERIGLPCHTSRRWLGLVGADT
jgi:hypothetical protein